MRVFRDEEECLSFRTCMGGDTMDAFAPLAQYTQRHHVDQTHPILQLGKKVATTITTPSGVMY